MLKVLLVDDELTVLNGMQYILAKHHPEYEILGAVQNSLDALKILETSRVNVVITDVRMPGMNGVELTKQIRTLYPETLVVVLSGYSDFEYVRQSMKNGAYDYLLKPYKYQDVFDILQKVEVQVVENDVSLRQDMDKKYFEKLLYGQQEIPEKWSSYDSMQIGVMSVQGHRDIEIGDYKDRIKREYEKTDGSTKMLEIQEVDGKIVMVFSGPVDAALLKKKFSLCKLEFLKEGITLLYSAFYNFTCKKGCFEQSYIICRQMIEYLEFNELSTVMDAETYYKYVEQQKKHTVNTFFSSNILAKYIFQRQVQKAQQYISTGINQLINLGVYMDPLKMKHEVIQEVMLLEHMLNDHGIYIEHVMDKKIDYINEIEKLRTVHLLLNWLRNYTMAVTMSIQNESNIPYYIYEAKKYLEIHYMDDISLKTVADEVYLNPLYFSTQFKKYVGLSFTEYLNQIRIRIAKELLQHKDLKVYQVSEMVGFSDSTYFNTVFKNIESITPKEYQKII